MYHLEREIALTAGPLTVAVERIPGQEIPGLTSLAQHRGDHGAELTGVTTPLNSQSKYHSLLSLLLLLCVPSSEL